MNSDGNTRFAYLTVTALFVLGFLALTVDLPVGRFCLAGSVPGELRRFLNCAETFGNGYGVLLIALTIRMLDPARTRKLPRLLACAYGAGIAANILKLIIPRVRPHHFDFQQAGVFHTFINAAATGAEGDVWTVLDSSLKSFPSGHTATAVGLAVALGWLYPNARRWFFVLSLLVACQRVECGAHFVSDVFWGAAIGYPTASFLLEHPAAHRIFARVEMQAQVLEEGSEPAETAAEQKIAA